MHTVLFCFDLTTHTNHFLGGLDFIHIRIIVWVISFLFHYHIFGHPFFAKLYHLLITGCINQHHSLSDRYVFCMIFCRKSFLHNTGDLINISKLIWHWIKTFHTKKITQELSHSLVSFIGQILKKFQISSTTLNLEPSVFRNGFSTLSHYHKTWFIFDGPWCHHKHGSPQY